MFPDHVPAHGHIHCHSVHIFPSSIFVLHFGCPGRFTFDLPFYICHSYYEVGSGDV